MPAAIRRSVVLPQPDCPSRQAISPALISKFKFLSIGLPAMLHDTFSNVSCPAIMAPAVPRWPQRGRGLVTEISLALYMGWPITPELAQRKYERLKPLDG